MPRTFGRRSRRSWATGWRWAARATACPTRRRRWCARRPSIVAASIVFSTKLHPDAGQLTTWGDVWPLPTLAQAAQAASETWLPADKFYGREFAQIDRKGGPSGARSAATRTTRASVSPSAREWADYMAGCTVRSAARTAAATRPRSVETEARLRGALHTLARAAALTPTTEAGLPVPSAGGAHVVHALALEALLAVRAVRPLRPRPRTCPSTRRLSGSTMCASQRPSGAPHSTRASPKAHRTRSAPGRAARSFLELHVDFFAEAWERTNALARGAGRGLGGRGQEVGRAPRTGGSGRGARLPRMPSPRGLDGVWARRRALLSERTGRRRRPRRRRRASSTALALERALLKRVTPLLSYLPGGPLHPQVLRRGTRGGGSRRPVGTPPPPAPNCTRGSRGGASARAAANAAARAAARPAALALAVRVAHAAPRPRTERVRGAGLVRRWDSVGPGGRGERRAGLSTGARSAPDEFGP